VEDLGIEAHGERERERETHTHTHTHTTFQRERKETRETKTCRKGRSLVVSIAKALRRMTTSFNIVYAKKTQEEFSGGQQEISQWVFASRKMSGRRTLCSRQAL